jgi:hypothetical protein
LDRPTNNVSFKSDNLSVYVRQPQVKFKTDWLYFFTEPLADLVDQLPNSARATLLDIVVLGHTTKWGLIGIPTPALLAWGMSRTRRYDALQILEEKGLLNNKQKGMVYLAPNLVYRGRADNYGKAVETWMKLGGE